jgi:hypothetical protein
MNSSPETIPQARQIYPLDLKLQELDAKLNEVLELLRHLLQIMPKTERRQIGFVINP